MQVPFYGRKIEIKQLNTLLHSKPTFRIMLGPPSSGKTALMKHVLQLSRQDGPPLYHHLSFDLRLVDVTSESGFLKEFVQDGMLSGLKEYFERMKIADGNTTVQLSRKEEMSLSIVLKVLADSLNSLSIMHGNRPCVLVIDEANEFKRLAP